MGYKGDSRVTIYHLEYATLRNGKLSIRDMDIEIPIGRSYKETVKRLYHEYGERMARRRM